MIEIILEDYLKSKLNKPVYTEIPSKHANEYYVIQKTSGRIRNHIRTATITVQSVAQSLYLSAKMNENVIEAMLNSISLSSISNCTLNSDYNFTNTASKQHRYQCVFDITYFDEQEEN